MIRYLECHFPLKANTSATTLVGCAFGLPCLGSYLVWKKVISWVFISNEKAELINAVRQVFINACIYNKGRQRNSRDHSASGLQNQILKLQEQLRLLLNHCSSVKCYVLIMIHYLHSKFPAAWKGQYFKLQ